MKLKKLILQSGKLRFLISLLVLMTLLLRPTNVTAQTLDQTIRKGTPAQFDGVLVPEKNYRTYQDKIDDDDALSQKLKDAPITCVDTASSNSAIFDIMLFVVGAAVGAVILHK